MSHEQSAEIAISRIIKPAHCAINTTQGTSLIKVHLIAAARPNFSKVAALYHALKATDWAAPIFVHTGQHYDVNLSDVFFRDLGLPRPDFHLGVGNGSHAQQTGAAS